MTCSGPVRPLGWRVTEANDTDTQLPTARRLTRYTAESMTTGRVRMTYTNNNAAFDQQAMHVTLGSNPTPYPNPTLTLTGVPVPIEPA